MKSIFLPAAQLILLVLWFTVAPGLPTWLVFLPLILWGIGATIAIVIVLGALLIAAAKGTSVRFK